MKRKHRSHQERLDSQARSELVRVEGPACAAWLVGRFKASIHSGGGFEVVVDKYTRNPVWFGVALKYMVQTGRWVVTADPLPDGAVQYRVFWKRKLRDTRALQKGGQA